MQAAPAHVDAAAATRQPSNSDDPSPNADAAPVPDAAHEEHEPSCDGQSSKRRKTTDAPSPPIPLRPLRIAPCFGAFDPVHENHVRQVLLPALLPALLPRCAVSHAAGLGYMSPVPHRRLLHVPKCRPGARARIHVKASAASRHTALLKCSTPKCRETAPNASACRRRCAC